jgi:ribonuclease HI
MCLSSIKSARSGSAENLKRVTIHTDGGCEGNPGPGGWAAVLKSGDHEREVSGGEPATTNNRMELQAAIGAMTALTQPCEVDFYTDSTYVRDGITKWIRSWKARGWRTTSRQPVKNEDLWRALDDAVCGHRIVWHWLKGHAGHAGNERCDQLAAAEIAKIRKQFTPAQLRAGIATFQKTRNPSAATPGLFDSEPLAAD